MWKLEKLAFVVGPGFSVGASVWLLSQCKENMACCEGAVLGLFRQLFSNTTVNIMTDGRGAAVGSRAYVADYISSKVPLGPIN